MHESVPSLGELNFGENKINQSRALLNLNEKKSQVSARLKWIEENLTRPITSLSFSHSETVQESVPCLGERNFGENEINQSRALLKFE